MPYCPSVDKTADPTAANEAGMIDDTVPGKKRRLDGRRRISRETVAPAKAAMERFAGIGTKTGGHGGGERKTRRL
jgi:hypothetical protein